MPKKNKNQRTWYTEGSGSGGRKYYYEHDDRADYMRKVSFNANSKIIKFARSKDWDAPPNDEDMDIQMPGGSRGRFNPYKSGHSRKNKNHHHSQSKPRVVARLQKHGASCFKIMIPHGSKYSKSYVLTTLHNYLDNVPFIPFAYSTQGQDAIFFVDDYEIADKLLKADRQITTNDGFKMVIRVNPGFPKIQINADLKEKIKLAMSKRYNAEFQSLNLRNFHRDPELIQEFLVGLFKTEMLLLVIDIISENIPQLKALDLSDNKLYGLQHLSGIISKKIPNLTILHLSKNKIRELSSLDSLQGVPLVELALDGNPVCNKYKDQNTYIRYFSYSFR